MSPMSLFDALPAISHFAPSLPPATQHFARMRQKSALRDLDLAGNRRTHDRRSDRPWRRNRRWPKSLLAGRSAVRERVAQFLCRRGADGVVAELTPAPFNVGSRVHEYGGGAFGVESGVVVFSERKDGAVWVIEGNQPPRRIATPEDCRYADFELDLARRLRPRRPGSITAAVRRTILKAAIVALSLDDPGPRDNFG